MLTNKEIEERLTQELEGTDYKRFDKKQLIKGIQTEQEHNDVTKGDIKKTYKIARAHLIENPSYYDLLSRMENPKNYNKIMAMKGGKLTIDMIYRKLEKMSNEEVEILNKLI